ncbi:hypothetical protein AB0M22_45205 [Nocardia sp. NPDC051756]|uniref:hypothetical protein n=1 Tax=Nocardia sp. NPDC051756 TaxID=3154751 RepID=UPI00341518F2
MSVMITQSAAVELVYVSVDSWEYGCCGEVPAEGGSLRAGVTAAPDETGGRFRAPPILEWDQSLELVRFTGFSARWDPIHGAPRERPIRLAISWHNQGLLTPAMVADIVAVYQTSVQYRVTGHLYTPMPDTMEYTRMTAVERFPKAAESEQVVNGLVRGVSGALAGIRIRSCEEPSAEVLSEYHADLERASRTVELIGPASVFGAVVPGRGDRVRVDLSDPQLTLLNKRTTVRGVVRGQAGQVSSATATTLGGWNLADIAPGTPADTVATPLFVTLTVDAADGQPPSADLRKRA